MVQRLAVLGFIIAAAVAIFAFVQQQNAVQQAAAAMSAQAEADTARGTALAMAEQASDTQAEAEAGQATAVSQAEAASTAQVEAQASASAVAADAALAETAGARGMATADAQMTAAAGTVTAGAQQVEAIQTQSASDRATAEAQIRADATEEVILFMMLGTATAQVDLAQFAASAAEEDRAAALAQSRAAQTQVAQLESDLATAQFQLTGLPPAPTALPTTPTVAPTASPEPTATPRTVGETELSQNFQSEDGSIAFAYPADWFAVEFSNGGISMTNDRELLQAQADALNADQVYVDLFTLTSEQLGGVPTDTPVIEVATVLVDNITSQPNSPFTLDEPTELTLNAIPAARSAGSNGDNGLVLILLDVGSETYVVAAASTAPEAIETYEPILRAILETLAFTA